MQPQALLTPFIFSFHLCCFDVSVNNVSSPADALWSTKELFCCHIFDLSQVSQSPFSPEGAVCWFNH